MGHVGQVSDRCKRSGGLHIDVRVIELRGENTRRVPASRIEDEQKLPIRRRRRQSRGWQERRDSATGEDCSKFSTIELQSLSLVKQEVGIAQKRRENPRPGANWCRFDGIDGVPQGDIRVDLWA